MRQTYLILFLPLFVVHKTKEAIFQLKISILYWVAILKCMTIIGMIKLPWLYA